MAGSIVISNELRMPVNSRQFDYLVERTRHAFNTEDEPILRRIYSDADDGGMNSISAASEDAAGLRIFFQAIVRARAKASVEPSFEGYGHFWEELLSLIRRDSRYSNDWERPEENPR